MTYQCYQTLSASQLIITLITLAPWGVLKCHWQVLADEGAPEEERAAARLVAERVEAEV